MSIIEGIAREKDFVKLFTPVDALETAIEWIAKHLSPDDVFNEQALETWARDNGFVKEEEDAE